MYFHRIIPGDNFLDFALSTNSQHLNYENELHQYAELSSVPTYLISTTTKPSPTPSIRDNISKALISTHDSSTTQTCLL